MLVKRFLLGQVRPITVRRDALPYKRVDSSYVISHRVFDIARRRIRNSNIVCTVLRGEGAARRDGSGARRSQTRHERVSAGTSGSVISGRFPAIVERTPYNKDGVANSLVGYFVSRGYAVVIQDVRGRYRSGGRWSGNRDDGPDGADLLKWIGEQPWSNGKVGTMGTSYGGATQHAMAIANAPNLAATVPVDAMSNAGRFGIRHNGAFELRWMNWILTWATQPVYTPPRTVRKKRQTDMRRRCAPHRFRRRLRQSSKSVLTYGITQPCSPCDPARLR